MVAIFWAMVFSLWAAVSFADSPDSAQFKVIDGEPPRADLKLGNGSVKVVIDTGATWTAINTRFRHLLGDRLGQVPFSTSSGNFRTPQFTCPAASVGGLAFTVPFVACFHFGRDVTDQGVDGLVGMDFLKDYCLDIDWGAGVARISLAPPEDLPPQQRRIPLSFSLSRRPCVLAKVGSAEDLRVTIEYGSSQTVSLAATDVTQVFPDGWKVAFRSQFYTVRGLVGCIAVRLPELAIGNATATNILGSFRPDDPEPTTVGCEFLCDYRTVFDFPNRTLVLVPRAKPRVAEMD